jgi:hypothetical protein
VPKVPTKRWRSGRLVALLVVVMVLLVLLRNRDTLGRRLCTIARGWLDALVRESQLPSSC